MGLSIEEFKVAMETYGAKRLYDQIGSRHKASVPAFEVGKIYDFIHSGSYYVINPDDILPEEILNKAMAEVGEEYPGGENFWYEGIHSVRGLLTLAAMLDGKYTKELVDKLINETYKKLLGCYLIKFNHIANGKFPLGKDFTRKILEYDNIVNPFGNKKLSLKDPIEYMDTLTLNVSINHCMNDSVNLSIKMDSAEIGFSYTSDGWTYQSFVNFNNDGKKSQITIAHVLKRNPQTLEYVDEIVRIYYDDEKGTYRKDDNDFDLRISKEKCLLYKPYGEELSSLVSDEQLDTALGYLETSIKEIQQRIISHMTI